MIISALKRLLPSWFFVLACCREGGPISFKISFLLLLQTTSMCCAAELPAPTGRFTFEGSPYIGTATLTNTVITNQSLYLNGIYFTRLGNPFTADFKPTFFNYRRFTVAVKLRPEDSCEKTLFAGGTSHRWFVLRTDKQGQVELSFNNHGFRHSVESLIVTNGQWITIALSFDLQSRRAIIYADGNRADEVVLPTDFDLKVINDATWKESDKVVTFTDYAKGNAFAGLVAGVMTFDTMLSADQVRLLFAKH